MAKNDKNKKVPEGKVFRNGEYRDDVANPGEEKDTNFDITVSIINDKWENIKNTLKAPKSAVKDEEKNKVTEENGFIIIKAEGGPLPEIDDQR